MLKLKLQYFGHLIQRVMTHLKRPWCWKRLKAGEGDDRGWDGWMASLIQWTWVWASSGNWWWTGKPGVLYSMGSLIVRHNWVNEINWTELILEINKTQKRLSSNIYLLKELIKKWLSGNGSFASCSHVFSPPRKPNPNLSAKKGCLIISG